ncbi:hypothetical protein DUD61_000569 [Geotrichum candidum]|nr:hypothetical protein DUD61_000569 [Geotrichum candidum]
MSTLDLDDEPHQFEVELLSSNTGAKTRIQNKCFHKGANSATTNEDEENYFRHARDELPKLATLSHRPHLYHFDAHDPAPGPSIGWGEPPKHANDNSDDKNDPNDTGDNNYVEEDHDEEEQEEKEETPAQLLSTRPVLHDLGNSGIGPTQQSTFAKGIFD